MPGQLASIDPGYDNAPDIDIRCVDEKERTPIASTFIIDANR